METVKNRLLYVQESGCSNIYNGGYPEYHWRYKGNSSYRVHKNRFNRIYLPSTMITVLDVDAFTHRPFSEDNEQKPLISFRCDEGVFSVAAVTSNFSVYLPEGFEILEGEVIPPTSNQ